MDIPRSLGKWLGGFSSPLEEIHFSEEKRPHPEERRLLFTQECLETDRISLKVF